MEIRHGWLAVKKRHRSILTLTLAATAAAAGYAFSAAPQYRSSTGVLLEQKDKTQQVLGYALGGPSELSAVSRVGSPLETQAALVRSPTLLARVIAKLGLVDPRTGLPLTPENFLEQAKVTNPKGTDLLVLAVRHPDARQAQRIATVWAEEFLVDSRGINRTAAIEAAAFLEDQAAKARVELAAAEESLRDYKARFASVVPSEAVKGAVQTLTHLETELHQTTAAHRESQRRLEALRREIGLGASEALVATALSQDANVQRLRQQLLEAETDPLLASSKLTAKNPQVGELRTRIAALKQRLREETERIAGRAYMGPGARNALDPVRQGLTRALVEAEVATVGYASRIAALERLMEHYKVRLGQLPEQEFRLTRLERRASLAAERYKLLSRKLEDAKLQAEMSVGNVRVVMPAQLPTQPSSPHRLLILLLGALAGLLAGVALAVVRETLDDALKSPDEVERALKQAPLGVIPWVARPEAKPAVLATPRAPVTEAYRALRTSLRFLLGARGWQTLAFTSAGPGEGKSTLVANLGLALAQNGARVLIVDADMRKPTQHVIFGLRNTVGLSSVLEGRSDFAAAVQTGPVPSLRVLTAGALPDAPADLLDAAGWPALLDRLKAEFDFVLFDAPPALPVTDAGVLAPRLDGVVLTVGLHRVSAKAAREAWRSLKACGAPLAGVVVNGLRPEHDAHYRAYHQAYFTASSAAVRAPGA